MPASCVVDTNVAVIANGRSGGDADCELACVELLRELTQHGSVALDVSDRIFTEYRNNLGLAGQPGVGDAFMRWVATNRFNPSLCEQIELCVIGPTEDDFAEFPSDPRLASFDPADRKFVAVANAPPPGRVVHVAIDRDWKRHAADLAASGVNVNFVCG